MPELTVTCRWSMSFTRVGVKLILIDFSVLPCRLAIFTE